MSVRGYIIAIDLNSGWIGTFSAEFNQVLYDAALKRAGKLIDALRTGKEPEAEEQFYCSLCPHKSGCPALEKGKKIELPDDVKAMVKEVKSLSDSEKKAKELKAQIKAFMEACEAKTGIADELTVSYQSRAGVKTLDTEALATRYPEIDFSPFYKQGEGFSYVMVR
jgi:CRISPR-associated exonuclease Cas4